MNNIAKGSLPSRLASGLFALALVTVPAAFPGTPLSRAAAMAPNSHTDLALIRLAEEEPDTLAKVIVRKNSADRKAEQFVQIVGGAILRELGVINGFSAELPARFLPQLAQIPSVKWVSPDAIVRKMSSGAPGWVVLSEDFNELGAAGEAWTSDANWPSRAWSEIGESDGRAAGDVVATTFLAGTAEGLRLQGAGKGVESVINISDATDASLTMAYRRKDFGDETQAVVLQQSVDGGATWTDLHTFSGPANDQELQTESISLTQVSNVSTTLRLITADSMTTTAKFYVDYLSVNYAPKPSLLSTLSHQIFVPSVEGGLTNVAAASTTSTHPAAAAAMAARNGALSIQSADTIHTVEDWFADGTFTGNYGTDNWSSNWIEYEPYNLGIGPLMGRVTAKQWELQLDDYPYSGMRPSVARRVDLRKDVSSAVLKIYYHTTAGVDASDGVALELSRDGGNTYTALEKYIGITGETWREREYDISGYLPGDVWVRYRVTDGYSDFDESFLINGTSVQYDQLVSPGWNWEHLIPASSNWRYNDKGADLGTAWRARTYNDSAWAQGASEFGYGDYDETTVLNAGPDINNKYITTYFRRSFNVPQASVFTYLNMSFVRDDGMVVYLNGNEIYRNNMPSGSINYRTLASTNVEGFDEYNWQSVDLPSTYLVDGENVLAVEIHQAAVNSSDISFGLYLGGQSGCADCQNVSKVPSTVGSTGAQNLWNRNWAPIQGQGVAVAVLDSGIAKHKDLGNNLGTSRVITSVKFTSGLPGGSIDDYNGHGTHIAGTIAGNGARSDGSYIGMAPMAKLVDVRVMDDLGRGSTSDVVAGLQWVNDHRQEFNIRVINLSLNTTINESRLANPIDAAIEVLWMNDVVVVVSSGNNGSNTLYAPANDPFAIVVGAVETKGTTSLADDKIPSFSAWGVTEEGITKPDLVAPGRDIISLSAGDDSNLSVNHGSNKVSTSFGTAYFKMSGTSMASAFVAGAAALLRQAQPTLTADQVKARLMSTANKNFPDYTVQKAGAGELDVVAAVNSTSTASANSGLRLSGLLAVNNSSGNVYLTSLTPTYATNGYGPFEPNREIGSSNSGDGVALKINGVTYASGIGAHAPSDIRYNLAGQYVFFAADIGVDDLVRNTSSNPTIVFQVWLDNVLAYDSGVLTRASATKHVLLDVKGKQQLRLVATDAGDGISWDHADWADAKLVPASATSVNWGSVNWGSVNWGSVNWGSVNWGSVNWGSVNWASDVWDDAP